MTIISFKAKKKDKKLAELTLNLRQEYTLNEATIKQLGLAEYYPNEVLKMLLKAAAFNYFKFTRYPISLIRFLTMFEENLTMSREGNTKNWYFDQDIFAKTECDNLLIEKVSLFNTQY